MKNTYKPGKTLTNRLILFLTGYSQVFFVAVNTYLLSKEIYIGVLISAFVISMIWSFNIKRIAFGSTKDRLAYATGAALGSVVGLYFSTIIASILSSL